MMTVSLLGAIVLLAALSPSLSLALSAGKTTASRVLHTSGPGAGRHMLHLSSSSNSNSNNNNSDKGARKIVKYDNVGDPVYEDELNASGSGMNILGFSVALDPLSLSLLIFGAIAFNFFVLANL